MSDVAKIEIPAPFVQAIRRRSYDQLSDCGDRLQGEAFNFGSKGFDIAKVQETGARTAAFLQLLEQLGWEDAPEETDRIVAVRLEFLAQLLTDALQWTGARLGDIGKRIEDGGGLFPFDEIEQAVAEGKWFKEAQQGLVDSLEAVAA